MTVTRLLKGPAPRSILASSKLGFNCLSLGETVKITYGVVITIWAIISHHNPKLTAQQKSAKSNGEGLQGHGNAEKLKRKREHGENGNDRRKESGKRDLKRAGM